MTKEEIRKKAIECAKALTKHCKEHPLKLDFGLPCIGCEYDMDDIKKYSCSAAYGYEHGFADGLEEGKQIALADLAKHDKEVIQKFTESLKQEIDYLNENGGGIGDLYFWLEQMKGEQT